MAQVIATLCDECLAAGDETPGETWEITLAAPGARPAPYALDACERHGKGLRDMLAALAEHGRRTDRKQPLPITVDATPGKAASAASKGPRGGVRPVAGPQGHVCPVCGHTTPSEGGLRTHVQHAHGMTLGEATGEHTTPCPSKGCPRKTSGAVQGVMAHLRTAHGLDRDAARALIESARE